MVECRYAVFALDDDDRLFTCLKDQKGDRERETDRQRDRETERERTTNKRQ